MGKVLGWLFGSAIAIAVIAYATMLIAPLETVSTVKDWTTTAYEKVVDVFTPDDTTIDEPNENENEENKEEENKENTENGTESGDVNTDVTPQPSVLAE